MKILKRDHAVDKEYFNRFLKEAKASGFLTHPNIVTVYDVGKFDDVPYIMMELLEGETMTDVLKRGEKLPIKTVLQVALQIASALDYAHSMGVVHRDIKPDNIIFKAENSSVKIADFGIARRSNPEIHEATQAGMILGTPRYMSPEQARGESVDGRSDLFSLGVVLYEMLTGHKAFTAESMPTLILQIIQEEPEPIRRLCPDVPTGLQAIVNKLLQKKPERRFQRGRDLQEALERELRNFQEEEEDRNYVPIQIKWTAILGGVVALVMAVCAFTVFHIQTRMLTEQMTDSGVALATFIASESAVPVLGEDWIGLESIADGAARRNSFAYLVLSDHDGTVRAATDKALIGKPLASPPDAQPVGDRNGVAISSVASGDGSSVYNFSLPILFKDTPVGRLDLGVGREKLDEVMGTTGRVMTVLALTVVLTVLLMVYLFNKLMSRNLLLVKRALLDLAAGNLSLRISRKWQNEFGVVASAFNTLADTFQKAVESYGHPGAEAIPATTGADAAVEQTPAPVCEPGPVVAPPPQTESMDYTVIDHRSARE
jgi:serine/threonine-protein kinase